MNAEAKVVSTYPDLDYVFRYRPPRQAARILDCGCETGGRALAIAQRGFPNVIGVDASTHNIAMARRRARTRKLDISFVEAKPWARSFPAKSFDEILLFGNLFAHGLTLRHDLDLLVEMRRLLAPNGRLWIGMLDAERLRQPRLQRGNFPGHDAAAAEADLHEWLYDKRQIAALLSLLAFDAISYHALSAVDGVVVPRLLVHCLAPVRF